MQDHGMDEYYREDLAFIHDVGYADFALKSAPGILQILSRNKIRDGLVVDLGCGSGLWARELAKAHYDVLGVDISESMIRIARERVPEAEFRAESLFDTVIPPCRAVTSLGECLNYLFDSDTDSRPLTQIFGRVYDALTPGGVFVFDLAEPGQVRGGKTIRGFSEGEGWVVLVEKSEDRKQRVLTRRIVTFRKLGDHYRRGDEVHRQRLYKPSEVARELGQLGFGVRTTRGFGKYRLAPAHTAFIARKPSIS